MKLSRQVMWGGGSALVIIGLLGGVKFFQIARAMAEQAAMKMPPEAVTALKADEVVWPEMIEGIGNLSPEQGVTISAEEPGRVAKILFESGANVEKGQLLFGLDVSVEEADLRGAKAELDAARANFERIGKLKASGSMSQLEIDRINSSYRSALAAVDSLQARIARKQIVAPFSGRTGVRMVNVGQYLQAGTPLVPLYATEKLLVDLAIPQQQISHVAVGQKIILHADAFPNQEFEGVVQSINPNVDMDTRQVMVRGVVNNHSAKLLSGLFVRVNIVTNAERKFIAVPATSVQFAPFGDTIFVLENMKGPDGVEYLGARQQVVQIGARRGDQVAIAKGIIAGEQIATSGIFKLRQGVAVQIQNEAGTPSNEAKPNPEDA